MLGGPASSYIRNIRSSYSGSDQAGCPHGPRPLNAVACRGMLSRHLAAFVATVALAFVGLLTESSAAPAGPSSTLAACMASDVRDVCCPGACAAKNGPNWTRADDILRGCMRGLGCEESDVRGTSVFMACDCRQAPRSCTSGASRAMRAER